MLCVQMICSLLPLGLFRVFRTLHLSIVSMWCGVLVLVGTKNTLLNCFNSS